MRRVVCLVAISLSTTACFHTVLETGAAPSNRVIEQKWAHGFVAGLIAPDVMSSARSCPNGVSVVETEHSFLNMLATAATVTLYTPMSVKVTCASGPVVAGANDLTPGSQRNQGRGGQGGTQGGRRPTAGGRGGRRPPI